MLALADKNGVVEGSIPGLADLARVTVTDCEQALANLQKPDKYSRSQDHEGRRIRVVDGGWLVLNHAKYRERMSADNRREYLREKQREHRARCQHAVNSAVDTSTLSTHTEAEASPEADAEKHKTSARKRARSRPQFVPPTLEEVVAYCRERGNQVDPQQWLDHYSSNGWKVGRNPMKDWKAAVRTWERNGLAERRQGAIGRSGQCAASSHLNPSEQSDRYEYALPVGLDEESGRDVWEGILAELSTRVNQHSYDTWLKPTKAAGVCGKVLYIKLPTPDFVYIEKKYGMLICKFGRGLTVQFLTPQEVA
jgi:hypothetical protein